MVSSSVTRPYDLSVQPTAARHQVRRLLADAGWDGDVDAVALAVHEAMVNALRHAGGVTAATAAVDGGTVVVEVRDRGEGFVVPATAEMPDPAAESGRGLFLIRRLTSAASVTRSGDEVSLVLRFDRRPAFDGRRALRSGLC